MEGFDEGQRRELLLLLSFSVGVHVTIVCNDDNKPSATTEKTVINT